MKSVKLSPEEQAYLNEVHQKVASFRTGKLQESLKALGFTFASPKEEAAFRKKRITSVSVKDVPGKVRLYLDYGKPTKVMLAEYAPLAIQDSGEIHVRDAYYEAPKPGVKENELHIQYL